MHPACPIGNQTVLMKNAAPMTRHPFQSPVFHAGRFRVVELGTADIPALQTFFEANPEYFLAVAGQPPRHDEAREEFNDQVPAGMPFRKRWLFGFIDEADAMVGMASIVSDLLAEHVWHIGLFVVATSLHGSGTAMVIHEHIESWMRMQGAEWMRLGVVEGNRRAERFWEKAGYIDVHKRTGVEMGSRVNTLRIMVRPLAGGTRDDYWALVARDRPA